MEHGAISDCTCPEGSDQSEAQSLSSKEESIVTIYHVKLV